MVMPTVVFIRGFRVRVHFNEDGEAPHVPYSKTAANTACAYWTTIPS